jgi:hypothetical protein
MRPSILNPLFADAIPEIGIAPPSKRRDFFYAKRMDSKRRMAIVDHGGRGAAYVRAA